MTGWFSPILTLFPEPILTHRSDYPADLVLKFTHFPHTHILKSWSAWPFLQLLHMVMTPRSGSKAWLAGP